MTLPAGARQYVVDGAQERAVDTQDATRGYPLVRAIRVPFPRQGNYTHRPNLHAGDRARSPPRKS